MTQKRDVRLDGRSRLARRARTVERALAEELGGGQPSAAKTVAIRRAAELYVISEDLRGRWLAGDPAIKASEIATVDNALKRAVDHLGLSPQDLAAKADPTANLDRYLAETYGADDDDGGDADVGSEQ